VRLSLGAAGLAMALAARAAIDGSEAGFAAPIDATVGSVEPSGRLSMIGNGGEIVEIGLAGIAIDPDQSVEVVEAIDRLCLNARVRAHPAGGRRDRAYIELSDGRMLQAVLLEEGLATDDRAMNHPLGRWFARLAFGARHARGGARLRARTDRTRQSRDRGRNPARTG
jgi:hypothetical protein